MGIKVPKSLCYIDELTGTARILIPCSSLHAETYDCLLVDADSLKSDDRYPRHYMNLIGIKHDDVLPIVRRTYNADGTTSEQPISIISGRIAAQLLNPKTLPLLTKFDNEPSELNYDEDQERS